jgi:hypothetical protein
MRTLTNILIVVLFILASPIIIPVLFVADAMLKKRAV